jgi:hypothetical protein
MLGGSEPAPRVITVGMRGILIAASILVLGVGFPLFLFPQYTDVDFAWTINPPIMAAALGASYLASSILEVLAARARIWVNTRVAVPAVLIFTVLTLAITLVHIDRFHLFASSPSARFVAWVWLAVYMIVPMIMSVAWFRQTRIRGPDLARAAPISLESRALWFAAGAILMLGGVCLLVAPAGAAAFWPWSLTPLTGRAVGAWLVGLGVLSAHAGFENDLARLCPIFPAMTLFAILHGIVLIRFHDELDWTRPSAWLYALTLTGLLGVGLHNWALFRCRQPGARRENGKPSLTDKN